MNTTSNDNAIKIVIVGKGGVGKTHYTHRLGTTFDKVHRLNENMNVMTDTKKDLTVCVEEVLTIGEDVNIEHLIYMYDVDEYDEDVEEFVNLLTNLKNQGKISNIVLIANNKGNDEVKTTSTIRGNVVYSFSVALDPLKELMEPINRIVNIANNK